jgi:hypothetical protein
MVPELLALKMTKNSTADPAMHSTININFNAQEFKNFHPPPTLLRIAKMIIWDAISGTK